MGFRVFVKEELGVEYLDVSGYNYKQDKLIRQLFDLSDKYENEFPFYVHDMGTENYDIEISNYTNFLRAVEKEYGLQNNDERNLTPFNSKRFGERFGIFDAQPLIEEKGYEDDGILQIYYHWTNCPSAIKDDYIHLESF